DHAPRHDHHTEIDLAALGEDPALVGVAELEAGGPRLEPGELATSPGSWDTQVRERGLPDSGAIVRGASDAPMLLARMFARGATGRITSRRDELERRSREDQDDRRERAALERRSREDQDDRRERAALERRSREDQDDRRERAALERRSREDQDDRRE